MRGSSMIQPKTHSTDSESNCKAIRITEPPDVGVLPKWNFGLSQLHASRPLIELVLLRRRAEAVADIAPRPRISGRRDRAGAAVHGARDRAGGRAGGAAGGFHQCRRHITLSAFFHKVSDGRRAGISVINDIDKKMGSTQRRKPVVPMRRRIGPKSEFLPRLHRRVSAQSAHQRYDYC
jgi:hypothetical protein